MNKTIFSQFEKGHITIGNSLLEEKKIPKKLDIELDRYDENLIDDYRATNLECDLAFKINEIIDYLKNKGE